MVSFLAVEPVGAALAAAVDALVASLGSMFLLVTTIFLVFALYLAFARAGGDPAQAPMAW